MKKANQKQKIILAADHAGFKMKEFIKKQLIKKKLDFVDVSPVLKDGDDYPDHVKKAVKEIIKKKDNVGVFACGTGVGVNIAANKHKGIRSALLTDNYTAKKSRTSNNANVACLRGWNLSREKAWKYVQTFLKTPFDKQKRRVRRIKKLDKLK